MKERYKMKDFKPEEMCEIINNREEYPNLYKLINRTR